MKNLIILESEAGKIKKSCLEVCVFGHQLSGTADQVGLHFGTADGVDMQELGQYGIAEVVVLAEGFLDGSTAQLAKAIEEVYASKGCANVLFPKTSMADGVAPVLSVGLGAPLATNVLQLMSNEGGNLVVKRAIYTGKAFANTSLAGGKYVLTIKKNAVEAAPFSTGSVAIENSSLAIDAALHPQKVTSKEKATGQVLLSDAEIVVSGGRGLKGPENWGLIENLASALGAATGCSKPVSDMDWRPHHEHVGQTGIKVSPNLYIAVGISGAIQHVAGINGSKVIVAINKDPEAPIFKAADYGIVGDAFDILPRLTEAIKNHN